MLRCPLKGDANVCAAIAVASIDKHGAAADEVRTYQGLCAVTWPEAVFCTS